MGLYGAQISVCRSFIIMVFITPYHLVVAENNISEKVNLEPKSNKPEQIHLSIGSSLSEMNIMWASKSDEEWYVDYGVHTDAHIQSKRGRIPSLKKELTIHHEKTAQFVYKALLTNLVPGLRYSYYIRSESSKSQTKEISFQVPHNNPQQPHKFVVVADMGLLTKCLPFMIHEILNGGYEVVFHVGDIAYNLGSYEGSIGDQFMNKISNFTARVPYMTTPGDHEMHDEFYHYRYRFSMPNSPWPMMEDSLWYSIEIGYTHFISINTQLVSPHLIKVQRHWLSNDLINANRNRKATPWIIVMGHKPMYCSKSVMTQDCDQENSPVRDEFEDLFFEHGVDLFISGHKHCYERSWPMYNGRVFQTDYINPIAPIHIISGTMGYEYIVDRQYSNPFWLAFAASFQKKELFARLTVTNETHLTWSAHVGFSNEEVDNVQVIQNHHGSFGLAGPTAFKKIQVKASKLNNFPPEPFFVVDAPNENQFRRVILYSTVFVLSLMLVAFLRNAHIRKVLCIRC